MRALVFDLEEFVDCYFRFVDLAMQDDGVDLLANSHPGFGEDYQDRLARRHLYSDTEEFCDILARRQGFDSKQEYISYLCMVTGSYDLIGFCDRMRLEFDVDHCPVFANLYMTLIDGRYWKAGEE